MATLTSAESSSRLMFVLGTGRCGSTLVHEILSRHREVGFVSNIEDRLPLPAGGGRWNQYLYERLPVRMTQKGRLRFAPSEAYRILDRRVSPMLSSPVRDLRAEDASPWLARELQQFFGARMAAQQRPVFLHKFTGWPRIGLLHEVFPDAPFIHIVRDGRAVVNSWLQMPWWTGYHGPDQWWLGPLEPRDSEEYERSGRSFVVLAAIAWKILMRAFAEAQSRLPEGRFLQLRYEDVVSDPQRSLHTMLDFAGLPWTPQFESALARYRFDSSRTAAFERDLSPQAQRILEESLREPLEQMGYV